MKQFHSRSFSILLLIVFVLISFGCGKDIETTPVSPFSDATWDDTAKEILAYEGDDCTTYDSVYGGLCYTYPKTYEGRQGTIKYMLDEEECLKSIAFTFSAENEQDLYGFFELIEESINTKTPFDTDKSTGSGHIWYRKEGNIVLSLMITSDLKALQYAYLHPDVSSKADDQ